MISVVIILFTACQKETPLNEEFSFPSQIIHKIIVDSRGTKWIATDQGLVSFDGKKWKTYPAEQALN
ncbi:MAG: hypothetical protein WAO52_13720 [Prolixibacteraceae bacterium]